MNVKRERFRPYLVLILLLSIFFLQNDVLAGTSGKIAGKITDSDTGEPLLGANIIILETTMGAAADIDGDYFIINIPPGTYQLKISMLSYSSVTITNVVVNTDRTTILDIELVPEAISTEEVVIVAEKPVIRADLTASIVEVDARQIEVKTQLNVQTLLKQQRGVILSNNQLGKEGNYYIGTPTDGLHIRGGRENETSFSIDGMVVNDPVWGGSEFIQNSSGNYIDEMSTLAGTFNAEFGNAMSGVVNVITKDGSNQNYHGTINLYTDRFGIDKYDHKTIQGVFDVGGPVPFTNNKLTFLVYGERKVSDGYLYGYYYPNWSNSKGLDVDPITKLPAGTGEKVSMDKSIYLNTSAKLKWTLSSAIRITAFGGYSELRRDYYDNAFRFYQAGMPHHESEELFLNLNWTHTLSTSTYYTVGFGHQKRDRFLGTYRDSLSYYDVNTELSESNNFWYSGEDWQHQNEESRTNSIRAVVVSQINKGNLVKIGGHYRGINVKFFDINPSGAPYTVYQNYDYDPIEIAAYIQDKMEFSSLGLIINLGVRFDSWNVDAPYNADPINLNTNDWKDTEVKTAISPRFGISYPISDFAAFHFAYGHFYQMPAYNLLYQGHRWLTDPNDIAWNNYPERRGQLYRGITEEWHYFQPNTNMDPEKTVSYEAGVQIKLSENVALDVTAFYRDMSELVGQRFFAEGNNGNGLVIADNFDYGNSKGIEFSIDKRFSNYWGLRLNYTFTNSQITSSTPWAKLQIENPTYKTYTSDWDQPHTLNFDLYVGLPSNWDITFSGSYSTGLPYTIISTRPNTERSPYFAQFDFRLSKTFEVLGIRPQLYFNILNLFDRRNIYGVYPSSGQPDLPLNVENTPLNLARYDDPSNYGPGRRIYIGAAISF